MGTGALHGSDPREMAKSDCVVIWGTNAVATQVNVMTHAVRARKERGAKIVVIDIYDNATMKQADMGLILKPGTDGALACAVMHVLFRDGMADRAYLEKYTDDPHGPRSASQRTGRPNGRPRSPAFRSQEIEAFARLVGTTKRTFFRLGYGFARQRNGSVNMHAALSIAAVTGCWQYEGGGAFHSNSGIFKLDKSLLEGTRLRDPDIRYLDHSRIGPVLVNAPDALYGGPPVTAMLIQNTNPANVAPEQRLVKQGLSARRPLHLRARAVHDRHGQARRCRAAGDHVPRARRHLSRRRQPAHQSRAEADRAAGGAAHQPFRHRGTGKAPRRRRICRASA